MRAGAIVQVLSLGTSFVYECRNYRLGSWTSDGGSDSFASHSVLVVTCYCGRSMKDDGVFPEYDSASSSVLIFIAVHFCASLRGQVRNPWHPNRTTSCL